jgi:DNA polymerase-1
MVILLERQESELERERIVIIDGNSLVNRAYYAIQRPMITKEGLYTQGIYGFLSMLQKIRNDYEPTHMLVAWDRKAPTFRHQEYDEYKAGRQKMPPELAMQLPLLKDVLSAMNIRMYEVDGYEADDIIGTVVKRSEEDGLSAFVITGDKDALQLASDQTTVIITKKGISEFAVYDEAAMLDEFGFGHVQFIDYKGLRGDPSDNIPGVPGIGEKTALKLIRQFGSIESLLERIDEIDSPKLREKMQKNASIAMMSKRLATIFTQVPLPFTLEECRMSPPKIDELIELYSRLEFRTHMKKLMEQERGAVPAEGVPDQKRVEALFPIRCLEQKEEMQKWLMHLDAAQDITIDILSDDSHIRKPSLDGIEWLVDGECVYLPGSPELAELLQKTISGKALRLNGFDLQRIYYVLMSLGVDISRFSTEFDCALAQYVISPNKRSLSLKTLLYETFHKDYEELGGGEAQIDLFSDQEKAFLSVSNEKLHMLRQLKDVLEAQIREDNLDEILYTIEFPLSKILADMELQGIAVDKSALTVFGDKLKKDIHGLEKEIYELAGQEFNINSPQQLGQILFEELKLPGEKKTKRGYATNAEILEKLAPDHLIVEKVLSYRTLAKLNSTYVEGMIPLIDESGKIHAHFQQAVAATGRISCTEPNLQNIPIRQELGRQLRKAFVAESKDHVLVGADYSQIELRVLAHMSQDPTLIDGFNQGLDIHRITASKVFGIPEDQVTAAMRSDAKAVNFGVIYGMGGFRLANELTISRAQAQHYIDEYFVKYDRVKAFMDQTIRDCREKGYVTTMFGRKRPIPEINASAFAVRQLGERLAMNTPIQGSAADIIKLAMIKVHEALDRECPKSKLILQIHDELIIQAHRTELEKVKNLLENCMKGAAKLDVTMDVSLNEGKNWYLLK